MKIICTNCGSIKVVCEAWINPNNDRFDHFSDDSFGNGYCKKCQEFVLLTDVHEVQARIKTVYKQFKEKKGREPEYLTCYILDKNRESRFSPQYVRIQLEQDPILQGKGESDGLPPVVHTCKVDELKKLCDHNVGSFIITGADYFL